MSLKSINLRNMGSNIFSNISINKNKFKKFATGIFSGIFALLIASTPVMLERVQAAETDRTDLIEAMVASECAALESIDYIENEILVAFHSSTGKEVLAREGRVFLYDVEVESVAEFGDFYVSTLRSPSMSTEELLEWAYGRGYVEVASANACVEIESTDASTGTAGTSSVAEVTSSDYSDGMWHLNGADTGTYRGSSNGINISRPQTTALSTPVVVVMDTGVDYTHEDLADSMWVNPLPDEIAGTYGYDFANGDDDPMDTYGHGTHVAGIIAAGVDNGVGFDGISTAKIMALKVALNNSETIIVNKCATAFSYVYRAMTKGVNVVAVNCSWGGSMFEYGAGGTISFYGGIINEMIDKIGELGALTVFAAGNDGADIDKTIAAYEKSSIPPWSSGLYKSQQDYMDTWLVAPYDFLSEYVVTVGATDTDNKIAPYSNYSSRAVNLFAPGNEILSCWIENRYMPQAYSPEKRAATTMYYNTFSESDENILPNNSLKVYTASDLGLSAVRANANGTYTRLQGTTEVLTNEKGDSYIKFTTTAASFSESTPGTCDHVGEDLYVDVTDLNLDTSRTYHIAFNYCYTSGNETADQLMWGPRSTEKVNDQYTFVTVDGRTYMSVVNSTGALVAYVDDIAISYADLPESELGKYFSASGTSMAAPMVTGAIAYLRSYITDATALEIRNIIIDNVAKSSELAGYCTSSGVLDMSAYPDIIKEYCKAKGVEFLMPGEEPEITVDESGETGESEKSDSDKEVELELNKTNITIRYSVADTVKLKAGANGKYTKKALKKAGIKASQLTWKTSKSKWATVDSNGKVTIKKAGIGHTVKITVKSSDGRKAVCKIKIRK